MDIRDYKTENDKRREYFKKYYEKNKEKLNSKTTCACGTVVAERNLARHLKTRTHQNWIEHNNIIQATRR